MKIGAREKLAELRGLDKFEKCKVVYEMMNNEGKCFFIEGNEGHRFYADDTWPVVHKLIHK